VINQTQVAPIASEGTCAATRPRLRISFPGTASKGSAYRARAPRSTCRSARMHNSAAQIEACTPASITSPKIGKDVQQPRDLPCWRISRSRHKRPRMGDEQERLRENESRHPLRDQSVLGVESLTELLRNRPRTHRGCAHGPILSRPRQAVGVLSYLASQPLTKWSAAPAAVMLTITTSGEGLRWLALRLGSSRRG